jgi:hypothetical protein
MFQKKSPALSGAFLTKEKTSLLVLVLLSALLPTAHHGSSSSLPCHQLVLVTKDD